MKWFLIITIVLFVLTFVFPVLGLISLPCLLALIVLIIKNKIIQKGNQQLNNTTARVDKHKNFSTKFKHPTKANANPIPANPRYFNINSTVFHKSKECESFSILGEWDAISEPEAQKMGMAVCTKCESGIAFIYQKGKVYHKTKFCSDSLSIPTQISVNEAESKGLRRCSKCY